VTLIDVRGEVTGAATTDGDGRFVLGGLHAGDYTVTVTADDSLPIAQALTVEGVGAQYLELLLPSDVRVAGTVRAAGSNRPVLEASVTLVDAEGNVVGTVLTGEDGHYEFTGRTPGRYTLAASGYAPVAVPVQLSGNGDDHDLVLGTAAGRPEGANTVWPGRVPVRDRG
jgi:uncharacterized surface anchored protein